MQTDFLGLESRNSIERTSEETSLSESKTNRLAAVFKQRRYQWISTEELISICSHRFSTNIQSLRDAFGFTIEKRKQDGSSNYEYRLTNIVEVVRVPEWWKESYYETEHWKKTRLARMSFDEYQCRHCRSKVEIQVHHWHYDLFKEDIEDLVTLCRVCHTKIHNYPKISISFPKSISLEIFEMISRQRSC